jgi:hypothetical protein
VEQERVLRHIGDAIPPGGLVCGEAGGILAQRAVERALAVEAEVEVTGIRGAILQVRRRR